MQPKRDNQPNFFDLAMQQRGAVNKVLETITREVDLSEAERRVASTAILIAFSTNPPGALFFGEFPRFIIRSINFAPSAWQINRK